jgi:hypothetical protein
MSTARSENPDQQNWDHRVRGRSEGSEKMSGRFKSRLTNSQNAPVAEIFLSSYEFMIRADFKHAPSDGYALKKRDLRAYDRSGSVPPNLFWRRGSASSQKCEAQLNFSRGHTTF